MVEHLVLSLFIIQNKLTLIFIIFINLINLNKINIKSLIVDKRFIFVNIFFIIWLTKNILSSGCLLYPIKLTCYEKLKWVNIEEIQKVSTSAEAWTKGWSNKSSNYKISQFDFNKNFNWITSWTNVHLKLILNIIIPYLIFCLVLLFIIKLKYKNKSEFFLEKEYKYYFIILALGSIVWFLKSPLYRYGYSFIISFIVFIFILLLYKN